MFRVLYLLTISLWLAYTFPREVKADDVTLPAFDFRDGAQVEAWRAANDVGPLVATRDGMKIEITGDDPYVVGPAVDFPPDVPLVVTLRVRAEKAGSAQIFWYRRQATEEHSTRFPVPAGGPLDVTVFLPPLGAGYRLRLDPPTGGRTFVVEKIETRRRLNLAPPDWPKPTVPEVVANSPTISAGHLAVAQADDASGEGFVVTWRGARVATGHNRPWLGYLVNGEPRWVDRRAATTLSRVGRVGTGLETVVEWRDADGALWRLTRVFTPEGDNAIDVRVTVVVDQPRQLIYFPLLIVLPGQGSGGARKNQALLAGVEYLDDEPSSSTADVEGPGALRRVPHADKLTFPLMAVQQEKHFVGLIWRPGPDIAPLFDCPDRVFRADANVMGLLAPGATERQRVSGEVLPVIPLGMTPDRPLSVRATLIAGDGRSVVPAVQTYVQRQGLPALPPIASRDDYVQLAARGWLDTPIHDGGLFRHAVGNGFRPQPAADAVWMLNWLAASTADAALRERLANAAREALDRVPAGQEYHAAVGHLRPPVIGLVTERTVATIEQARQSAENSLRRFDEDGVTRYHPPAKGLDYSRTSATREASGLAAQTVAQLLQDACYSGDRKLVEAGLDRLRKLDRYDDGVPRGAQTWEIPLHTPDILASAHLVQAYLLGYELSGERALLDRAIYWAWTGVPFVYLQKPYDAPVGAFATTPVLGATQWKAPVWIGLPVQWCGLVYAQRIDRLARHDPRGPWRKLADGITASAMQQVYPLDHPRQGLLPDSFQLQLQIRNPADINPGTLQPLAMRLLTDTPAYDFRVARAAGLWIHAPGQLEDLTEPARGDSVEFTVRPWNDATSLVMVHGLKAPPAATIDGQPPAKPATFLPDPGTLLLRIGSQPHTKVRVRLVKQ